MHRLFVGIDPPFDVKDALMEMQGGIIGARWQSEDQLHMTLRFLGDQTVDQANDIAEALAGISALPLTLHLSGVGTFDRRGRIDQLWARVKPPEEALRLHRKINRALAMIGVEEDRRTYQPHITLARFSRGAGPLEDFMVRHGDLRIQAFTVSEFCLYESILSQEGAEYRIVERYPFAQGALFGFSEISELGLGS
ncbi:MAG: RNA 2',3'-cyclic phosphodiesterase [Pacificimonas sp.]